MSLRRLPLPLLLAAACVLAWIGVDFSPGFSESFAACPAEQTAVRFAPVLAKKAVPVVK